MQNIYKLFDSLFLFSDIPVSLIDRIGRIRYINCAGADLLGGFASSIMGMSIFENIPANELSGLFKKLLNTKNDSADKNIVAHSLKRFDNLQVSVETRFYFLDDIEDPLFFFICRDISGQLLFRDSLKVDEEKIIESTGQSALPVFILNNHLSIQHFNPAFMKLTGYQFNDLLDADISEIIHPENYQDFLHDLMSLMKGETSSGNYEVRIINRARISRWISLGCEKFINNNSEFILCGAVDITDYINAEIRFNDMFKTNSGALVIKGKRKDIIPICSSCKKIRITDMSWIDVEQYMMQLSGVLFSHGICPDCIKTLYPELHHKMINNK